jgi:hypothetical protein
MLGALDVVILFSEDRLRRKEKLDLRAAAAWKSPFNAGAAEGSGEPSLVKVLEGMLEGVVLAILIQRDAPVISMSIGLLACARNLSCRERRTAAEQTAWVLTARYPVQLTGRWIGRDRGDE